VLRYATIAVLSIALSGCPAVSASRQRDIRRKTADIRQGMSPAEVSTVLGEPSVKYGQLCQPPGMTSRTCQFWVYDPSHDMLVTPVNNRILHVMFIPDDKGRLYLAIWRWE
jgi:hypothetical protein